MDLSGQEAVLGFRGFKEWNWEATSLRSCFLICKMAWCRSTGSSSTLSTAPGPGDPGEHVTASVLKDLTVQHATAEDACQTVTTLQDRELGP